MISRELYDSTSSAYAFKDVSDIDENKLTFSKYTMLTSFTSKCNDNPALQPFNPLEASSYLLDGLLSEVGEFVGKIAKVKLSIINCNDKKAVECVEGMPGEIGDILWYSCRLVSNIIDASCMGHFFDSMDDLMNQDYSYAGAGNGANGYNNDAYKHIGRLITSLANEVAIHLTSSDDMSVIYFENNENGMYQFGPVCELIHDIVRHEMFAMNELWRRFKPGIVPPTIQDIMRDNIKKLISRLERNIIIGSGDNR